MSALNIVMVADTGELEEFYRDVQNIPFTVLGKLKSEQKSYEAELTRMAVRRLSVYPPAWRSKQRFFQWSKNPKKDLKARNWWFAHLGANATEGGSYQRTGKTGRAWRAITAMEPKKDGMWIDVTINNPTQGASYVYGYIKDNWQRVPSHQVTGWLSAYDSPEMNATIDDVFQITLETIDNVAERLDL